MDSRINQYRNFAHIILTAQSFYYGEFFREIINLFETLLKENLDSFCDESQCKYAYEYFKDNCSTEDDIEQSSFCEYWENAKRIISLLDNRFTRDDLCAISNSREMYDTTKFCIKLLRVYLDIVIDKLVDETFIYRKRIIGLQCALIDILKTASDPSSEDGKNKTNIYDSVSSRITQSLESILTWVRETGADQE